MYRQSFLTADFFVTAPEEQAKEILASLPGYLSHLTMLKENTIIHSTRFLYHNKEKESQCYIDVSTLKLNEQYIRFNLHGSYLNGQHIQNDSEIRSALQQFEQSVFAALNQDAMYAVKKEQVRSGLKKGSSFLQFIASLFLSRYHY
jgi:hypothetical protein